MPVNRPYFRCVRPGLDGEYLEGGRWMYVLHPSYAPDATHYLRAFSILQGDLIRLFEYIEPADANESAYSFRCLELLVRACGEVEANCRVILDQNGYAGAGARWTMSDYVKLERTHRLSSYRIRLPVWAGVRGIRQPFAEWKAAASLPWFQAHHGAKHNRHAEFSGASLENAVDAVAGVLVLLSSSSSSPTTLADRLCERWLWRATIRSSRMRSAATSRWGFPPIGQFPIGTTSTGRPSRRIPHRSATLSF